MKKFLSILLVAVLVSAMIVLPVSAEDELFWAEGEYDVLTEKDDNIDPHHAWGYVFTVDTINTMSGNTTAIFTQSESYTAGKWASKVVLAPTSEANVYEVVAAYQYTGNTGADDIANGIVNFDEGQIVLAAQDSGTRPEKLEDGSLRFPNWEERAAIWGLVHTLGAKVTLAGIDVAAGTMENGTVTVEANPNAGEEGGEKEVITHNLVASSNAWELAGNGEYYYDGDILFVHANENWPCIQTYYAEAIAVNIADFYLVYDIEVEGATNVNFIFANGGTFSISNTAFDFGGVEYDAGSGDILAGTYKGKIALTDLVAANANYQNAAFPASEVVDGVLTFAGINVFSVGTDVDVVVNKLALVTEVEEDEEVVEITNVALNKEYTVSGNGDYTASYYGNVTDGIVAEDLGENKNAEWFGFYHNGDRPTNAPDKLGYFIFDLEDVYDLSSIRLSLVNETNWGIPPLEYAKAYASVDGETYTELGSFEISSEEATPYWTEIEATGKAKFVKVEFKLGGTFGFVSEVEIYGGKGGSSDKEDEEPAGPSVEELMKEALGEAPAAPKFDLVINAPESYEAGDDITVTVTIKNITAENGLHLLEFVLNYDNTKLLITNDIDEEEDNALVCIENLPKDWENFCKVANDYDENNEDGTTVNPLNDGVITATVFTAKNGAKFAITEDESLVFTFTFKALEDSKGDIGIVIPHAGVEGALNTNTGADKYEGNGTYAVIKAPVVEEPKPNDPVKPGDASNMIVFAIIALVAIAGSAVVIKTRK